MAILSFNEAAHLLRRAGFGGKTSEIDELVSKGSREAAVDFLINYDRIDNSALDTLLNQSFDFSDRQENDNFNRGEIRRWWLTRMVHSRRQFEEKLTLFWHDHFATALSKVAFPLMHNQNLTLRSHALDRFDDLLLAVAKDPAMLTWLDGITNVRGRPNENFARELQELFSMGIFDVVTGEPNYTEEDIKEIARAFTGWRFRTDRQSSQISYQWFVQANNHDNGPKRIFGDTANFSGEDVVTLISARRSTARFLAWKLFNFFVYPMTNSAADKATIEKFADVYMQGDHSMKSLLRAIFTSDEFFSQRAFFSLIKSPIELVVGGVRMIGQYVPGPPGRQSSNVLFNLAARMGQSLYDPPDVDGWDGGPLWVNTSYMLERFNFANSLATNRNTTNPGMFISVNQLSKYTKKNAKKTVKKFLSVLGPLDVENSVQATLRNYLETNDQGVSVPFEKSDAIVDKKIRGLVHQIMCLPEFQLN
jgi:uncharacterized protein (DUF1800 family)